MISVSIKLHVYAASDAPIGCLQAGGKCSMYMLLLIIACILVDNVLCPYFIACIMFFVHVLNCMFYWYVLCPCIIACSN